MAVVNVGTAINKALGKMTGGLPRATMVPWFNEVVHDILNQPRVWKFLTEPLTLTITNNQIILPAGVSEVVSIQISDTFFTKGDQLSDEEAASIDAASLQMMDPPLPQMQGYTMDATGVVITFHPGQTGSAMVTVEQDITADYADNADTIFPLDFENLFVTGLLKEAFYVDKDGRFSAESTKYQMRMGEMRAWDNRRKPVPHFNPHGYIRGTIA